MRNNVLLLCLASFFALSIASEGEKKIEEATEEKIKKSKDLRERLSRQLDWFEPAKLVFNKSGKTESSDTENEARFLKFGHQVGGSSISQTDLLFNILTTAVNDVHHVCEEIADKFERFVIDDESLKLARRLGEARLFQILAEFRATTVSRANAAAAAALAATGGGGGAGGGLLGGLLGGGGGGGGLLGGLLGK
ncbi:UNVERIFIED_CONTAM: hypothetical protein RMT77_006409 [Armadillidium vulgare]